MESNVEQLQGFLEDSLNDEAFKSRMTENQIDSQLFGKIRATLIVLKILEEAYPGKKHEWEVIYQNASKWLESSGVSDITTEQANLNIQVKE